MASGAQQLAADFEQVQNQLLRYPSINLLKTEGDPPDRYDIEYNVKGYELKSDGSAAPSDKHQIRITLPFGYPHFPPTVKPLTPIFHPDIDPDAIRIADFWQNNKSLAELIIHIGKMICGISYQREEPFNQEAYNWYEERQDWLPFDTLDPVESDDNAELTGGSQQDFSEVHDQKEEVEQSVSPPGESLDILNEDLDFPFDDETEDIDLDLSEDTPQSDENDLTFDLDLTDEEPSEEIEFDFFEDDQDEPEDDLTFSLEEDAGEDDAEESIQMEQEPEEANQEPLAHDEPEEEEEALFDLPGEDEEAITFDLLEEEENITPQEQEGIKVEPDDQEDDIGLEDIELGDLGSLDDNEQPLGSDQDEADEDISLDLLDENAEAEDTDEQLQSSVDLSGLEKEDQDTETEEAAGEHGEENIDAEEFASSSEDTIPTESDDIPGMDSEVSLGDDETDEDLDEESLAGLELDDAFQEVPENGSASGKSRAIRPLIEQKKMFTAKKVLADVTDPGSIADIEELEEQITHAITKAEDLYRKADKLEQAGELEKAGLTLDLVANEAVDYPGLEFARNRIRESLLAKDSSEDTKSTGDEGKETGLQSKKKKRGRTRTGFKLPYRIIVIVLILIAILSAATWVTIKDTNSIKRAYTDFQKARELLEKKDFKQAQTALQSSSTTLDNIIFLQQDEKEQLQKKIEAITDSENYKEGLKGRVLYDGKYVTVAMAKKIDTFNNQMIDAEARQNSGEIDEAIKYYQQAAETAKQINFAEQEKNIRQTINRLQLKKALNQARLAEEEQEWKQAADTYAQALELSKNLSSSSDKIDIENKLAVAAFRHEVTEGQRAFTASEWQKTIEMLQNAEEILKTNPEIATESEKEEIRKLLVYSRLYHILSGAKNAFTKEEWEMAVNQYKNAIYLLENNQEMLGDKADTSIDKIKKTILMTQISREQHQNTVAIENNKQEESLKSYRTIASLIENSSFRDDETLGKILEDARSQIVALENEIRINSRVDWLKQNYEEIFRAMYPSARSSELLNPQVTFIKEEDDKLIFTMSCVEKRQGRSFRLQLNYQYDQKQDSWDIYSGKL